MTADRLRQSYGGAGLCVVLETLLRATRLAAAGRDDVSRSKRSSEPTRSTYQKWSGGWDRLCLSPRKCRAS